MLNRWIGIFKELQKLFFGHEYTQKDASFRKSSSYSLLILKKNRCLKAWSPQYNRRGVCKMEIFSKVQQSLKQKEP